MGPLRVALLLFESIHKNASQRKRKCSAKQRGSRKTVDGQVFWGWRVTLKDHLSQAFGQVPIPRGKRDNIIGAALAHAGRMDEYLALLRWLRQDYSLQVVIDRPWTTGR